MMPRKFRLTLLTPLFSRGSYDAAYAESAEVRAPSVRGQLHHWFRQLGYDADLERAIFGAVQEGFGGAGKPTASKVVIRVAHVHGQRGVTATLPHKQGGQASPKAAYLGGSTFEVHVLERLGGLTHDSRKAFDRVLEAWLLAGSLGLRSTRGAGAFQWEEAPQEITTYRQRLAQIVAGARIRLDILSPAFKSADEARTIATDTVSHKALASAHFPLGAVKQGRNDVSGAPPRKTSPLRLTVRKFTDGYRLIALWDARSEVTQNSQGDLNRAIELLAAGSPQSAKKRIGEMLAHSSLVA